MFDSYITVWNAIQKLLLLLLFLPLQTDFTELSDDFFDPLYPSEPAILSVVIQLRVK